MSDIKPTEFKPRKMDLELATLNKCMSAILELDDAAQQRIMSYLVNRFQKPQTQTVNHE
jgi:hypothetical protein